MHQRLSMQPAYNKDIAQILSIPSLAGSLTGKTLIFAATSPKVCYNRTMTSWPASIENAQFTATNWSLILTAKSGDDAGSLPLRLAGARATAWQEHRIRSLDPLGQVAGMQVACHLMRAHIHVPPRILTDFLLLLSSFRFERGGKSN